MFEIPFIFSPLPLSSPVKGEEFSGCRTASQPPFRKGASDFSVGKNCVEGYAWLGCWKEGKACAVANVIWGRGILRLLAIMICLSGVDALRSPCVEGPNLEVPLYKGGVGGFWNGHCSDLCCCEPPMGTPPFGSAYGPKPSRRRGGCFTRPSGSVSPLLVLQDSIFLGV